MSGKNHERREWTRIPQRFSLSVFQCFSVSVFQSFSLSVFQSFSLSVFQPFISEARSRVEGQANITCRGTPRALIYGGQI